MNKVNYSSRERAIAEAKMVELNAGEMVIVKGSSVIVEAARREALEEKGLEYVRFHGLPYEEESFGGGWGREEW